MEKQEEFKTLLKDLSNCNKCTNLKCKEKSLINIYQDYEFCTSIPSIWTDWFNRLNKEIMIIGQDWGPYNDMKKLNEHLKSGNYNWNEIVESEKSSTKKLLNYYIKESSDNNYCLDDSFITNAIMCARCGDNYRGNNIDLKKSTLNCYKYLERQINIIKPKVILTLGYYPLLALSKIFNFEMKKTLKEMILFYPEIKIGEYIIIPLYHPVAQIRKIDQLKQYKRIWKYIDKENNNESIYSKTWRSS